MIIPIIQLDIDCKFKKHATTYHFIQLAIKDGFWSYWLLLKVGIKLSFRTCCAVFYDYAI